MSLDILNARREHQGLGPGRKLGSADLQLLCLALLADGPLHGYGLIKAFGERSGGYYVPSPGVIYPALRELERQRRAVGVSDGQRKRFRISAEGRRFFALRRGSASDLWTHLTRAGERLERVRRALEREDRERTARFDAAQGRTNELAQSRVLLQRALQEAATESAAEQQRVANILNRALADILGKTAG